MTPQLTPADIEKMRQLVNDHDKKTSVNEFDLNNPPRVNYVHQDWPRLMYGTNAEGREVYKKVADREEHEAALEAGWSNTPVAVAVTPELALDPADAAEVAAVDEKIAAGKAKAKTARK
jgi:hypothetical protein